LTREEETGLQGNKIVKEKKDVSNFNSGFFWFKLILEKKKRQNLKYLKRRQQNKS